MSVPSMAAGSGNTRKNGLREADDFYRTPASCVRDLLKVERLPPAVWEPACGDGAISRVLLEAGHAVVSTDLVERGFGASRRDFLFEPALLAAAVVTNPPFKLADEFVLHALHLGAEKVAMFMRLAWLEGGARHDKLWSKHPPARVWAFSKRQTCWRGDDANPKDRGGAIAFAWFIWERGNSGAPALGWINNDRCPGTLAPPPSLVVNPGPDLFGATAR